MDTTTPAQSSEEKERNWLPMAIAAGLVLAVVAVSLLAGRHSRNAANEGAGSGAPDPYAASISITNLAMSESSNLAGGKVTYLDGHIANSGNRIVTGVVVEAVFRDYAKKVAQSGRVSVTPIRMREPYIDTEAMTAAPLQPGAGEDFRLIFDTITPDWAGEMPELRVVHVELK